MKRLLRQLFIIEAKNMNIQIIEGILIPFLGTALGAAMVFLLKKQIADSIQKALTGFAAGVISRQA